ncbi:hypothetical protein W97_05284 [Coniosporium apollinis CBS 100218]|uniref:RTA1 like protein n=1 Tax=Coniosporium apollinis (strain CBS 100218) TaxID=1168221 RepID=R7YWK5_CONA1|nr:uncharacterized protein W97_05284 [Coniosporium apollinis CBS 100218]EON66041.1 hypothetical protein W97_05284 [Coniosporium apollinis CBS 100218]
MSETQPEEYDVYNCTKDTCPASESIYGYAPSLGANAAFIAIFSVSAVIFTIQGVRTKTRSFSIAMVLGCFCEALGHGGRIMLHYDPFSEVGFKLQICLLTFAPAFLAAGVYLCLKHLVITFGAHISRIKPAWYTYIFISCDVLSLALQGAGGGLASAATGPGSLMNTGNNLMMAGLSFQVFTLLAFATLVTEYFVRVWRHRYELNPRTEELRRSRKFRWFLGALVTAYVAILFRCIYRIAEMAGGWGNPIMRDETTFIVLDSL